MGYITRRINMALSKVDVANMITGTVGTSNGGFAVASITGATALAVEPASTDEILLSDAGTLKRMDFAHIMNTPSFHAHASGNISMSDNTLTKITFSSEDYDTSSTYDNSSNYRFTPGIAEKYFLYYKVVMETGANNNNVEFCEGHIYKNGSTISKMMTDFRDDKDGRTMTVLGSSVVESDADDYFEIYALMNHDAGSAVAAGGEHEAFFGGFRMVGA